MLTLTIIFLIDFLVLAFFILSNLECVHGTRGPDGADSTMMKSTLLRHLVSYYFIHMDEENPSSPSYFIPMNEEHTSSPSFDTYE